MTERSEYNGKPVIVLKNRPDDKYPFSFGVKKAELILSNLGAIEEFVAEHGTSEKPEGRPF